MQRTNTVSENCASIARSKIEQKEIKNAGRRKRTKRVAACATRFLADCVFGFRDGCVLCAVVLLVV